MTRRQWRSAAFAPTLSARRGSRLWVLFWRLPLSTRLLNDLHKRLFVVMSKLVDLVPKEAQSRLQILVVHGYANLADARYYGSRHG